MARSRKAHLARKAAVRARHVGRRPHFRTVNAPKGTW